MPSSVKRHLNSHHVRLHVNLPSPLDIPRCPRGLRPKWKFHPASRSSAAAGALGVKGGCPESASSSRPTRLVWVIALGTYKVARSLVGLGELRREAIAEVEGRQLFDAPLQQVFHVQGRPRQAHTNTHTARDCVHDCTL
jgi:hypothetical protein